MKRFSKVLECILIAIACPLFFVYVLPWIQKWTGFSRETLMILFVLGGVLGLIGGRKD
jgi:predicted MFS family arabinose efflux permease